MGRALRDAFPAVERHLCEIDAALGYPLSAALDGPEALLFPSVDTPQPSVFIEATAALSLAAARSLAEAGAAPAALAGRSVGEYAAAAFAGVFSTRDCFRLLRTVGSLAQRGCLETPSLLVTVYGPRRERLFSVAREMREAGLFCEIVIYYDRPRLGVAAIKAADLDRLKERLSGLPHRLSISREHGAFHSSLFDGLARGTADVCAGLTFSSPSAPLYLNLDGAPESDPAALRSKLPSALSRPVLWQETIAGMLADGITTFVEMPPGIMLTEFLCDLPPGAEVMRADTPENYLRALERLIGN